MSAACSMPTATACPSRSTTTASRPAPRVAPPPRAGGCFEPAGAGFPEPLYYNGFKAGSDVVGPQPDAGRDGCGHMSYAHKLGVENMAAKAIQGRAGMGDHR